MATFSTHILNSLNGTHFSDIDVKLFRCTKTDKNELIFHKKTDIGGRLKVSFDLNTEIVSEYEVQVFLPNDFYKNTKLEAIKKNIIISYFSMRVSFNEPDITYHIPLIISPYGMSCWISR